MTELQTKILSMMKWFHNYCIENEIRYYMIGGTMLGAVRHSGFIPWDDDMDIGIPRSDYDRLLNISKSLKDNNNLYIIESYLDGNPDYQYSYAKLYDTSTTLIENRRTKPKRGIFIDLFPLDGISGDTLDDAKKAYRPLKRKLDLLAARTCDIRKGRSWWKNATVKLIGFLPNSIFNYMSLIGSIEKTCRKCDFYSSNIAGNLMGMWRDKEIMPRAYMGNPQLYFFEGEQFYGVEDYDSYLTSVYGDWRKLPPIDKQKSEHDFIMLDLTKSYKE